MTLEETMQKIRPVDVAAMAAAKAALGRTWKTIRKSGAAGESIDPDCGNPAHPEMCILIGKHWSSCVRIMAW